MTALPVASALSITSAGSRSAPARARLRERVAHLYGTRSADASPAPTTHVTAS